MYSSRIAWKFVPPNPNAFTPARRGWSPTPCTHGRASELTNSGPSPKRALGLGSVTPSVGGRTLWYSASATFARPATPAVAFVWPIIDFTEPMAALSGGAPASSSIVESASASVRSPTTVPVPWASNRPTVVGEMPAFAYARLRASIWPSGRGAVSPFARPSLEPPMPWITA